MAIGHAQRWKRIIVMSDDFTPFLSAPAMLEWASVPHLEYFAFCNNHEAELSTYPSSLEASIFKNGAPKLRSVVLDMSIGQGILPPLQDITTLCLEYLDMEVDNDDRFPWPTFVDVLSLPSLVNLSVMGPIFEDPPSFDSIDPIIMNNLKNLRFSMTDSFPLLLPFLKASLLETLVIKSESLEVLGDDQPEPLGFPSLKSLYLIETAIITPAAQYLARMTESVTDIAIFNEECDESLFFVFLCSSSEYWPKLKVVTLDLDIGGRLNEVISFAHTRRDSGLVFHVLGHVISQWLSTLFLGQPHAYAELAKLCRIERLDDRLRSINPVWQEYWPSPEWRFARR